MSKWHHCHHCVWDLQNKKLRLLENLESDDSDLDGFTNSSNDDDTSTLHVRQEVAAYVGPQEIWANAHETRESL